MTLTPPLKEKKQELTEQLECNGFIYCYYGAQGTNIQSAAIGTRVVFCPTWICGETEDLRKILDTIQVPIPTFLRPSRNHMVLLSECRRI